MATRTWDNGAATQNWEDANNWSDNTVPVTGDTAIIPDAMGTIVGTPSADVLTLVQVNGDSVFAVLLAATNFEFNGTSYNGGTITGICTFNDSSRNWDGIIVGNATFNDTSRYHNAGSNITGNVVFNDTSYNSGSGGSSTITGNCEFNDTSYSQAGLIVTGNCSFNDSAYNNNNDLDVSGTLSFNDTSYNAGAFAGDCVFNDTSYNDDFVTGNVTFNDSSYNGLYGWIVGTATFKDSSYVSGGYGIDAAIVRQSAAAFVAWRNYATSTYITTLTLQFPEMDILGTGLL